MPEKIVGILGGMGPEATVDLFHKIVCATPARTDQDHLRIIIDCNPKIPSRQAAVLDGGEDPTPMLQSTARNLEKAGADFIVVPCNSAHLFFDKICAAVSIPVLHIVDETVAEIRRRYPSVSTVGVMAAPAMMKTGLYNKRLEAAGFRPIVPDEADQDTVWKVIQGVKAGVTGPEATNEARGVANRLAARGAELLLTGCTELPLVLHDGDGSVPILDPTQVLAEAAVRYARSGEAAG